MNKVIVTFILGLTIALSFGCRSDNDNGPSLRDVENRLFEAGINVEYSQSSTANGGCLDLYDIDFSAVARSSQGVDQAVNALQDYRRVILNGRQCLVNPNEAENLIYRAISVLESCRVRWSNGRRC